MSLWYDGAPAEGRDGIVPFDLADRGLLLGDGLFDTALVVRGRVAFEAAHVARLVAGAGVLGVAGSPEAVRAAMRGAAGNAPLAALRTTLTRGPGPRGLAPPPDPRPLLFARAAPLPGGLAATRLRLHVTTIARNDTSPAAGLKTLGYLDAVLAAREARAAGFDEALFLNTRGRVACAGTGNLFALVEGRLLTPPLSDGVLPGIVRGEVLRLAPGLGLRAEERSLDRDALERAEAAFVTNSLRLIAPVTAIGSRTLPCAGEPWLPRLEAGVRGAVAASCGLPVDALA